MTLLECFGFNLRPNHFGDPQNAIKQNNPNDRRKSRCDILLFILNLVPDFFYSFTPSINFNFVVNGTTIY
jgi:hypothetical protein